MCMWKIHSYCFHSTFHGLAATEVFPPPKSIAHGGLGELASEVPNPPFVETFVGCASDQVFGERLSGTTVGRCMGLGPWPGRVVQGPLAVLYKAHENNRGVIRESFEET
jgi:hypothetical protein